VSTQPQLDWTATDERAVDLIRVARVSVEAGITEPWRLFVGDAGASIGVDHFGASAAYQKIYQEFGITAERVAAAARDSLARVRG
jgi:transketolase